MLNISLSSVSRRRIRHPPVSRWSMETACSTTTTFRSRISARPNTLGFRNFAIERSLPSCVPPLRRRDAYLSASIRSGFTQSKRHVLGRRFHSNQAQANASKSTAGKQPPTDTTTTSTVTALVTDIVPFVGTFAWRLCLAYGMVYIFWEYGVEITITEGPSMMHTLQGHGDEIVLMDRFTPARLGLQGGSSGSQRAELARQRQREFVQQCPSSTSSPHIWHEPKIPANQLPSTNVWKRFRANLWTPISVGDVVVLQHPDRAGTVCKRVLGLPGDIVTKPISRRGAAKLEWMGDLPIQISSESSSSRPATLLPYQANVGTLKRRRSASTLIVPDGYLWVEGDNPWNSNDSRNYGAIPASLIVGRVVCRIWPIKGHAMIERGDRPLRIQDSTTRPSLAFSGSIVFPAGYRGQLIIRDYHQWQQIQQQSKQSRTSTIRPTTKSFDDKAANLAATAAEPKQ